MTDTYNVAAIITIIILIIEGRGQKAVDRQAGRHICTYAVFNELFRFWGRS